VARSKQRRTDRCARCALPPGYCLCGEVPRLETRTQIVVVRHVRELEKPSGTTRIAALALPSLTIVEYRDEPGAQLPAWIAGRPYVRGRVIEPPEGVGTHIAELAGAALLFPTGRALAELAAPPRALVVLDGTWRQARAMYQRIPGVARLPALRLVGAPSEMTRLRRPIREGERSTLEAIADALSELEGDDVAAPLRALHARFVEQHLASRGR
jgi:DTW domain-containing protein YfiP